MSDESQITALEQKLRLAGTQNADLNDKLRNETDSRNKYVLIKVIFSLARVISGLEQQLEKARELEQQGISSSESQKPKTW